MKKRAIGLSLLVVANVLIWGVLSFHRATGAAPTQQPPFRNSVEQRNEMIRELKEIRRLLEEQKAPADKR